MKAIQHRNEGYVTESAPHKYKVLTIYSVNVTKSKKTADLTTFIEEILKEKLHFLWNGKTNNIRIKVL